MWCEKVQFLARFKSLVAGEGLLDHVVSFTQEMCTLKIELKTLPP